MWAKWQIGQVAAEPGASICHKDAPEATSITATIAAATLAPCNHRIFLVRVMRMAPGSNSGYSDARCVMLP